MNQEKLRKTYERFLTLPKKTPKIFRSVLSAGLRKLRRDVIVREGRYWYILGDRELPGPPIDDSGLEETLIVILGDEDDEEGQEEAADGIDGEDQP